jgi:hypoxanthine phosphoribosyltransferase
MEGAGMAQQRVNAPEPEGQPRLARQPAARPVDAAASPSPVPAPFAHQAEADFAELLNFYRIPWLYEPTSFAIEWDGDQVTEMFTPDFYLPDQDLYVEVTTMKQSLVTKKNRKVRRLRELYPELNIKLMYRRDYQQLVAQYGYGALEIIELQPEQIDRILVSPSELQERVVALGEQISADYADRTIILVGVLKGVTFFLADLARTITRPLAIDYLAVAGYGTPPKGRSRTPGAVRIIKDLDEQITGQHVLLVEDIVNTGLSLQYILKHLRAKRPASIAVCTLLDKTEKRLVDVPLDYVGFPCPNEFVIGYGLDYRERYRNLPFLCVLKPEAYEQNTPLRPREDIVVPETK